MAQVIIAVDGESRAGKSTLGQELARRLGCNYLDTGSLYRGATLLALRRHYDLTMQFDRRALLEDLHNAVLDPYEWCQLRLNGEDVSKEIRIPAVDAMVSSVAAIPGVRRHLNHLIHAYVGKHSAVVDGRDIGTVVFPGARLKLWVTASEAQKAERLRAGYGEDRSLTDVAQELAKRDKQDQNRAVAPASIASDAHILDTTGMTVEEEVEWVLKKWYELKFGSKKMKH